MIDLFQPGAYARAAGGNLERPDIQAPVVRWMAWSLNPDNGGGGQPAVWSRCRQLWKAAGIQDFPWLHCRSMEDIDRLMLVGQQNDSPAIGLNIENVAADFTSKGVSLIDIAQKLAAWEGEIHMATLCWVQNSQDWGALSRCVAALEIFIDEVPACARTQDCIDHAFEEGLTKVTLMLKTKPPNAPATYGEFFSVCHSLYTADDITPTQQAWSAWKAPAPCVALKPIPKVPLTVKQFPFTGPFYGPSSPKGPTKNKSSIKGLKRGMIRGGYLNAPLGSETDDFGPALEDAFEEFQRDVNIHPVSGDYGRGTWMAMRNLRVPAEFPNAGQYAMDALALRYVKVDALTRCYPHPLGALSQICQGLHATDGLNGNWAIDFCAPGGTKVLAVEDATITRLSGRDPANGADNTIGIFGWSIHYETPNGYRYFSTHYGVRSPLQVGDRVDVGQVLGTVGHWPGDPSRSHTHLGVTSPLGTADAKARITEISRATKLAA